MIGIYKPFSYAVHNAALRCTNRSMTGQEEEREVACIKAVMTSSCWKSSHKGDPRFVLIIKCISQAMSGATTSM